MLMQDTPASWALSVKTTSPGMRESQQYTLPSEVLQERMPSRVRVMLSPGLSRPYPARKHAASCGCHVMHSMSEPNSHLAIS